MQPSAQSPSRELRRLTTLDAFCTPHINGTLGIIKERIMNNITTKASFTYVIWTIIFWICTMYVDNQMTFIEITDKPSNSPPWYFILNDLRESFAAIIGFTLSLAVIFLYYRKKDSHSLTLIFFSLIWYGHNIGNGISILLNTKNVFNKDLATTIWSTHDQYLNSAWNSYIFYLLLFLLSILFIYLNKQLKKNMPNSGE